MISGLVGIGVTVGLAAAHSDAEREPEMSAMTAMSVTAANSYTEFQSEKSAPSAPPPWLAVFHATDVDGHMELSFQQGDLTVILCESAVGAETTCSAPLNHLIREEADGSREVRIASLAPAHPLNEVDYRLTDEERKFVLGFWQTVPLARDTTPSWMKDFAILGNA